MSSNLIRINTRDNVAVAIKGLMKGDVVTVDGDTFTVFSDIPAGHKVALCDIKKDEDVIKYGYPIGAAKENIKKGSHVHAFNIHTLLNEDAEYHYDKETAEEAKREAEADKLRWKDHTPTINAYVRKNGKIGIRNALWIIPTVGCVNRISMQLESWGNETLGLEDGVHAYTHPFGCSQLGGDHENTRKILADLVHHPNAGGVLVIGLGCENNTMDSFKELVGEVDEERVKFLVCQEAEDEVAEGKHLLEEIASVMKNDKREAVPMSRLIVGFKCGGSDGLSGITANPLVGRFCNELTAMGGTGILTEVPEMFGAEQVLMNRCVNEEVYNETVKLIQDFKHYFTSHGQVVYENPSPGNKAGGISTLEDKSLGCVQKGGRAPVTAVLSYGDRVTTPGLNLLSGPGNDIVSTTAQSAAGAHMILFTTGRGTPLGAPVPTVKIATNHDLAQHKKDWIDFDASPMLDEDPRKVTEKLITLIISIANGETRTKNEINGYSEISIFKDGVVL